MKKVLHTLMMLFMCSCIKEQEPEKEVSHLNVGDRLPTFTAQPVVPSLTSFSTDLLKGKVSMITLFTSECYDCRRELPKVEAVWKALKEDENFCFAAFSREQTANDVTTYWTLSGFTMPVYLDPDRAIFNLFAVNTVPRVYISDRDGSIVWMGVNVITQTSEELVSMIKNLE